MKTSACCFILLAAYGAPLAAQSSSDAARWAREAAGVTIIRDDWGIAHVYGRSDADAVFGMIYAQAEDDFNRVETNYLNSLGRLAEAEGERAIWTDLRQRLFINDDSLKAQYGRSPAWLKALMNAWADGLNFYLSKHPDVHPRAITRFEPWMALSFTEGSIGGDIERINLGSLRAFYGDTTQPSGTDGAFGDGETARVAGVRDDPGGSNGMAIAPSNTADHHALLLINPHTSFYFRSELEVSSEQGLGAYGAVTWGQFFVYQGFNSRIGWMHTSSGVDNIDEYLETVSQRNGRWFYRYGGRELPLTTSRVTIAYKTDTGMARRSFTTFRTRHGPVERRQGDTWVTISLMQNPIDALIQSYSRTKATSYREFARLMELHTNSSNNTVFADADGDIAYWHSDFIPRRDTAFDWTRPVDGSDPRTDWHGVLSLAETPRLLNPPSGWLYNSNNAPWWAAGPSSPRKGDFPAYVETGGESARGRHAERVLSSSRDFTLESMIAGAYDSYLPWFENTIPALVHAWEAAPAGDTLRTRLAEQIDSLRGWNLRWGVNSVPTALAVYWGTELARRLSRDARAAGVDLEAYVATRAEPSRLMGALAAASDSIAAAFGSWRTPWGDINRFQRFNDDIASRFDDARPSIPVPFTYSAWGSLASFSARPYPNTRKWYGTSGNSFVAAVEFGDSVRARAVTAGGESGDPASPHFNDEAQRYASGNLRPVYFYRSQLAGHTEREYHPGN